jgi:muramoyltetrapeptide carboxypeptidase
MKNIFPQFIKHIAVVAPAGPASQESVELSVALLQKAGIKVTIMPHVFKGAAEHYLSASAEERAEDIHACWKDESVDLVTCTRGGFGSAQLLDLLDWELLRSRPLPLIGYSDITALHMAMIKNNAGIPVTAPMAARYIYALFNERNNGYTREYMRAALLPPSDNMLEIIPPPESEPMTVIKSGTAQAKPFAANLAVLVTLCGTGYFSNLQNRILVIEDLNEPAYKIERYLTQLQQCGTLEKISGLLFGRFIDCGSENELNRIFNKFATKVNGPVISGFPFGHSFPNISLNMDKPLKITSDGKIFITA